MLQFGNNCKYRLFIWEVDNKGCVDAMKVCTTVLVDTLITLKMTKGHAHDMKIATKRSFNNVKKTQRFRT